MLESAPLTVVDALLRGMLLGLLLLLSSLLWREQPRSTLARAGIALAVGVCIQVISSNPLLEELLPRYWQAPLVGISVGNAVLFWIFVKALFDDDFALRRAHAAIWLSAVALGALGCILGRENM